MFFPSRVVDHGNLANKWCRSVVLITKGNRLLVASTLGPPSLCLARFLDLHMKKIYILSATEVSDLNWDDAILVTRSFVEGFLEFKNAGRERVKLPAMSRSSVEVLIGQWSVLARIIHPSVYWMPPHLTRTVLFIFSSAGLGNKFACICEWKPV